VSQYLISPSATQDLNAIADYFLSNNIGAGEKFFEEFNRKCKLLIRFPYIERYYKKPGF